MPRFITTKEFEAKELEDNKKLKPKLQKFVINMQRERAAEVATQKKKEEAEILKSDEVIRQASKLACVALLVKRIWKKMPSYLAMEWTTHDITVTKYAQELQTDIAGFTTFLCREYNNFLKYKAMKKGYRNPLNEEHLEWFWVKFNADLRLLIEAEKRRVAAGNKSIIINQDEKNVQPGIILPNGTRS